MAGNKLKYTPTEAIQAVKGLHRKKLYAMMKDRTIAYEKRDNTRLIDVHELIRVFADDFTPAELGETYVGNNLKQNETPKKHDGNTSEFRATIHLLQERIKDKDTLPQSLERMNTDLREDRDSWRSQAQRLLLTDQRGQKASQASTDAHKNGESYPAIQNIENPSHNANVARYGWFILVIVVVTWLSHIFQDKIVSLFEPSPQPVVNAGKEKQVKHTETPLETPINQENGWDTLQQSFPPETSE